MQAGCSTAHQSALQPGGCESGENCQTNGPVGMPDFRQTEALLALLGQLRSMLSTSTESCISVRSTVRDVEAELKALQCDLARNGPEALGAEVSTPDDEKCRWTPPPSRYQRSTSLQSSSRLSAQSVPAGVVDDWPVVTVGRLLVIGPHRSGKTSVLSFLDQRKIRVLDDELEPDDEAKLLVSAFSGDQTGNSGSGGTALRGVDRGRGHEGLWESNFSPQVSPESAIRVLQPRDRSSSTSMHAGNSEETAAGGARDTAPSLVTGLVVRRAHSAAASGADALGGRRARLAATSAAVPTCSTPSSEALGTMSLSTSGSTSPAGAALRTQDRGEKSDATPVRPAAVSDGSAPSPPFGNVGTRRGRVGGRSGAPEKSPICASASPLAVSSKPSAKFVSMSLCNYSEETALGSFSPMAFSLSCGCESLPRYGTSTIAEEVLQIVAVNGFGDCQVVREEGPAWLTHDDSEELSPLTASPSCSATPRPKECNVHSAKGEGDPQENDPSPPVTEAVDTSSTVVFSERTLLVPRQPGSHDVAPAVIESAPDWGGPATGSRREVDQGPRPGLAAPLGRGDGSFPRTPSMRADSPVCRIEDQVLLWESSRSKSTAAVAVSSGGVSVPGAVSESPSQASPLQRSEAPPNLLRFSSTARLVQDEARPTWYAQETTQSAVRDNGHRFPDGSRPSITFNGDGFLLCIPCELLMVMRSDSLPATVAAARSYSCGSPPLTPGRETPTSAAASHLSEESVGLRDCLQCLFSSFMPAAATSVPCRARAPTPPPFAAQPARCEQSEGGEVFARRMRQLLCNCTTFVLTGSSWTSSWAVAALQDHLREQYGVIVSAHRIIPFHALAARLTQQFLYCVVEEAATLSPDIVTPTHAPRKCGGCDQIHQCGASTMPSRPCVCTPEPPAVDGADHVLGVLNHSKTSLSSDGTANLFSISIPVDPQHQQHGLSSSRPDREKDLPWCGVTDAAELQTLSISKSTLGMTHGRNRDTQPAASSMLSVQHHTAALGRTTGTPPLTCRGVKTSTLPRPTFFLASAAQSTSGNPPPFGSIPHTSVTSIHSLISPALTLNSVFAAYRRAIGHFYNHALPPTTRVGTPFTTEVPSCAEPPHLATSSCVSAPSARAAVSTSLHVAEEEALVNLPMNDDAFMDVSLSAAVTQAATVVWAATGAQALTQTVQEFDRDLKRLTFGRLATSVVLCTHGVRQEWDAARLAAEGRHATLASTISAKNAMVAQIKNTIGGLYSSRPVQYANALMDELRQLYHRLVQRFLGHLRLALQAAATVQPSASQTSETSRHRTSLAGSVCEQHGQSAVGAGDSVGQPPEFVSSVPPSLLPCMMRLLDGAKVAQAALVALVEERATYAHTRVQRVRRHGSPVRLAYAPNTSTLGSEAGRSGTRVTAPGSSKVKVEPILHNSSLAGFSTVEYLEPENWVLFEGVNEQSVSMRSVSNANSPSTFEFSGIAGSSIVPLRVLDPLMASHNPLVPLSGNASPNTHRRGSGVAHHGQQLSIARHSHSARKGNGMFRSSHASQQTQPSSVASFMLTEKEMEMDMEMISSYKVGGCLVSSRDDQPQSRLKRFGGDESVLDLSGMVRCESFDPSFVMGRSIAGNSHCEFSESASRHQRPSLGKRSSPSVRSTRKVERSVEKAVSQLNTEVINLFLAEVADVFPELTQLWEKHRQKTLRALLQQLRDFSIPGCVQLAQSASLRQFLKDIQRLTLAEMQPSDELVSFITDLRSDITKDHLSALADELLHAEEAASVENAQVEADCGHELPTGDMRAVPGQLYRSVVSATHSTVDDSSNTDSRNALPPPSNYAVMAADGSGVVTTAAAAAAFPAPQPQSPATANLPKAHIAREGKMRQADRHAAGAVRSFEGEPGKQDAHIDHSDAPGGTVVNSENPMASSLKGEPSQSLSSEGKASESRQGLAAHVLVEVAVGSPARWIPKTASPGRERGAMRHSCGTGESEVERLVPVNPSGDMVPQLGFSAGETLVKDASAVPPAGQSNLCYKEARAGMMGTDPVHISPRRRGGGVPHAASAAPRCCPPAAAGERLRHTRAYFLRRNEKRHARSMQEPNMLPTVSDATIAFLGQLQDSPGPPAEPRERNGGDDTAPTLDCCGTSEEQASASHSPLQQPTYRRRDGHRTGEGTSPVPFHGVASDAQWQLSVPERLLVVPTPGVTGPSQRRVTTAPDAAEDGATAAASPRCAARRAVLASEEPIYPHAEQAHSPQHRSASPRERVQNSTHRSDEGEAAGSWAARSDGAHVADTQHSGEDGSSHVYKSEGGTSPPPPAAVHGKTPLPRRRRLTATPGGPEEGHISISPPAGTSISGAADADGAEAVGETPTAPLPGLSFVYDVWDEVISMTELRQWLRMHLSLYSHSLNGFFVALFNELHSAELDLTVAVRRCEADLQATVHELAVLKDPQSALSLDAILAEALHLSEEVLHLPAP